MNFLNKKYNYLIYSKPKLLMKWSGIIILWTLLLFIMCILPALYISLVEIPSDYQQGENYRILYIHVPFAWLCILSYMLMVILSCIYLLNKHPLLYLSTNIIAKLGTLFTVLTLITGSLWGLPMWGTWWVWDARLTSVLILLFIYISYLILYNSFDNEKGPFFSSILCLIGFINIPIIKYSVEWWSTLHQPSTIAKVGADVPISMSYPLYLLLISLVFYSIIIYLFLIRSEILKNKKKQYYLKNH